MIVPPSILRTSLVPLVLVAFLAAPAAGQQRPPKAPRLQEEDALVSTDPSQVDEDFAYQGEFRGWQREARHREPRTASLQVVALGNGQFGAANYPGGLPGEGWYGSERRLFAGERRDDVVELTSADRRLVVATNVVTLYDGSDRQLGEFHRVQRTSPTLGAQPPAGAIRLFGEDGGTGQLVNAQVTPDGLLMAGTETIGRFGDFRMHAEFRLPYKPHARGQGRGNSGFYLQSRYEVQVLDSFGLEGVENECGALYKTRRPDINMCLPPLAWQTYDIDLTSPRFDAQGKKLSNMRISVWHNGVLVHNNAEIPDKTGNGKPEGPTPLPIKLQDHGNPVVFRNLWLVEKQAPSGSGDLLAAQQAQAN